MKKFYSAVSVVGTDQGYEINLDDRPVKTPAKAAALLPTVALAEAVAEEWRGQGEQIRPLSMPLTQLANTALDRVPGRRTEIIDELAGYAETDLVCYRADGPANLKSQQDSHWQPLLDWAATDLDAPLVVTTSLMPVAQPEAALTAIRRTIETHDPFALAALHLATDVAGSVIIGLALTAGRLGAPQAFDAATVDERYQIEKWGGDDEATARLTRVRADLEAAAGFTAALAG